MDTSRKVIYTLISIGILLVLGTLFDRLTPPPMSDAMTIEAEQIALNHTGEIPPLPFIYDGCSLFIDSFFWHDFKPGCYQHDIAYWIGGSDEERRLADQKLSRAVAESGPLGKLFEYPVYFGVRIFGDSFLAKAFNVHWGFGWN